MTDEETSGVEAVFTYKKQPGNVDAWRIGEACAKARPGGDYIDHGLSLLQELEAKGFGIAALATPAASPATERTCHDIRAQDVEAAAVAIWQMDSWRAAGRMRLIPWEEAGAGEQERFRGYADAALQSVRGYLLRGYAHPPASPSPAPAAVEELVARLVEEVNEPTPELRALYADYRAAIASGRLKVDDTATALSTLAADKARIEAERDEARQENERLRAALAQSDQPCAYCSLPAAEWSKCQHGFPGCDRADDAMGCPHLGASLALDAAEAASAAKNERIRELSELVGMFRARIETNGEWDDGCFYYRNTSASELQEPLRRARTLTQPDTAPKETSHD